MQMHMLKVQPMVVPPLPWRSLESGGLLFTRVPVMRTRTAAQVQALQEAEAAAPDGLRRVSWAIPERFSLTACFCMGALCHRLLRYFTGSLQQPNSRGRRSAQVLVTGLSLRSSMIGALPP